MAQGKIIADTSQLDAAVAYVRNKAQEYNSNYTKLYGVVQQLKVSFDGADYQAFSDQIDGFRDDFVRMENLMKEYADYLKKISRDYRTTQENIAADAKRLSQGS